MPMPTDEQIIAAGPWWQRVTFPSGLTVGVWHTDEMMESLCAGVDLSGKVVMDIGCMAGVGTKWIEERGANFVVGCDIADLAKKQFRLVKSAFGLKMRWCNLSVYRIFGLGKIDMDEWTGGRHVVVMAGVYYHLEHPLAGLRKAWEATREVLCVEGEVSDGTDCSAEFIPGEYKGDPSNWWVPTVPCLEAWLGWLPGEKHIRCVTPEGYLANRAMYQVWRGAQ